MNEALRGAFESEMSLAKEDYEARDFDSCFVHLERAHVLGQRNYWPHVRNHWWMLKAGYRVGDRREMVGQLLRIIGSAGSLVGMVPLGNTGRANVSALEPMPIPEDLAIFFDQSMHTSAFRRTVALLVTFLLLLVVGALLTQIRHQRGIERANEIWRSSVPVPIVNLGETQHLSILPLVNWHATNGQLKTEAGVSYLVRTDQNTLLFDFGFNQKGQSPSPLEYNMRRLGIDLKEIDTLFLSHHHLDHAGGRRWIKQNSFSLGADQIDLADKRIFAPLPLQYPGVEVVAIDRATSLGNGLASIGPIRRQLALGPIDEQALAINVANHGIVLLVGCGHQTLERIIQRTRRLFDQPIYGVIGDLHYPLPTGRLELFGINIQHRLASGDGPFSPLRKDQIESDFRLLSNLNLGIVALGGHDTSDEILTEVEKTFGARSRRVSVGEWIEVAP